MFIAGLTHGGNSLPLSDFRCRFFLLILPLSGHVSEFIMFILFSEEAIILRITVLFLNDQVNLGHQVNYPKDEN